MYKIRCCTQILHLLVNIENKQVKVATEDVMMMVEQQSQCKQSCKQTQQSTSLCPDTMYTDSMALPTFTHLAAVCRAAIDRYLLPAGPSLLLAFGAVAYAVTHRRHTDI